MHEYIMAAHYFFSGRRRQWDVSQLRKNSADEKKFLSGDENKYMLAMDPSVHPKQVDAVWKIKHLSKLSQVRALAASHSFSLNLANK